MMFGRRSLHHLLRLHICHRPRTFATFTEAVTDHQNKNQIYISDSLDPFLNLSIEHYLLQKSSADSVVLFIYVNEPSIVIGRNQNPWNEINLNLVREKSPNIRIVRRRSGGGAVFHDQGNVNYCVIGPTSDFDRDKHAKMVVQALKTVGIDRVRVNDRHDIVLEKTEHDGSEKLYKISGSAYKLTKLRSLHHGTCLLSSPNLGSISQYLDSPAKKFIKARGVPSVSSKITNVGISTSAFKNAVIDQYSNMYCPVKPMYVGNDLKKNSDIAFGYKELKSKEWIYCQTPQFTFTVNSESNIIVDSRETVGRVRQSPVSFQEEFTARNGCIISTSSSLACFLNKKIHEINDWSPKHEIKDPKSSNAATEKLASFMNSLFGQQSK